MISLAFVWSMFVPLLCLILPGMVIPRPQTSSIAQAARVIMWSFATWTIVSFIVAVLHLPTVSTVVAVIVMTLAIWWRRRQVPVFFGRGTGWLIAAAAYLFFGAAFVINHDGLPTGDSQKAIFWGQRSTQLQAPPDYQQSVAMLNRDPVDFYTPGLHTLTGVLLTVSGDSLSTIGWLAIAASLAVAIVAMATAHELLPDGRAGYMTYLVGWLVITNPRFLRYLREPGYHLQNVVGELLLFGLLFIAISLLGRWRWSDAVLIILLGLTLLLSHQFSAFLAAFMLLPVGLMLLAHYGKRVMGSHLSPTKLITVTLVVALAILAGYVLGLHQKIPHLFTLTPHLRHFVLPISEYPRLLGFLWVYGGLAGLFAVLRQTPRRSASWGLAGALFFSLALSYGPWWGVDIPPVRALFYSIVPMCIALVVGVAALVTDSKKRPALMMAITLAVVGSGVWATAQALRADHSVRTNATLTLGQVSLAQNLQRQSVSGGVLVDDYNRRSSSWLLLSGRPMYTRLAADVRTHMSEAQQSALRQELYVNHMDYEKIFALGSFPEITPLFEKHGIGFVTGIVNSSFAAFAHNPALAPVAASDDITLFTPQPTDAQAVPDEIVPWLLRSSTLANDIGDDEDTFEHLPAALRSTRLSSPALQAGRTVRTTQAPYFTVRFNVRDYAQVLWSRERQATPDGDLEFYWQVVQAPSNLTLLTPTGERLTPRSHAMIRLAAASVPYDEQGFITLTIENPAAQSVVIDLIALGLARTP